MSGFHALQISPGAPGSALTPEQKRFNTLIRQIEQARRTLAAWRDNVPLYLQAHTQRIVPLLAALTAARGERAFAFDRLLDHPGWSRAERALLRELICDSVAEILEAADEDDAALKALFDKHADVDLDTERQTSRLALKDMMEAMTGLDLGDDAEIASDQDLFERMRNRLAAETAAAASRPQAKSAPAARPRRSSGAKPRPSSPPSRSARSFASWPVRCTPTARRTPPSARPRRH